jgi:hypothetical protein
MSRYQPFVVPIYSHRLYLLYSADSSIFLLCLFLLSSLLMLLKSLSAIILTAAATFPLSAVASECIGDQHARDECYMKIALDFAKIHNPRFPFGALIVDHEENEITCYGANSNKKNKLLHGETAAFWKYVPFHFIVYMLPFYFNQLIYCIAVPKCTLLQLTMTCSTPVLTGLSRHCTLLENLLVFL